MIQIKEFQSNKTVSIENTVNNWIKENDKLYQVIDIKFINFSVFVIYKIREKTYGI